MVYCAETRLSYLSRDTPGILCHYLPLRPVHTQRFFVAGSAHPYTLELMGPLGYHNLHNYREIRLYRHQSNSFFPLVFLARESIDVCAQ